MTDDSDDPVQAFGLSEKVTVVARSADGERFYHETLISPALLVDSLALSSALMMMEQKLIGYAGGPVEMERVIFSDEMWLITDGAVSSVEYPRW